MTFDTNCERSAAIVCVCMCVCCSYIGGPCFQFIPLTIWSVDEPRPFLVGRCQGFIGCRQVLSNCASDVQGITWNPMTGHDVLHRIPSAQYPMSPTETDEAIDKILLTVDGTELLTVTWRSTHQGRREGQYMLVNLASMIGPLCTVVTAAALPPYLQAHIAIPLGSLATDASLANLRKSVLQQTTPPDLDVAVTSNGYPTRDGPRPCLPGSRILGLHVHSKRDEAGVANQAPFLSHPGWTGRNWRSCRQMGSCCVPGTGRLRLWNMGYGRSGGNDIRRQKAVTKEKDLLVPTSIDTAEGVASRNLGIRTSYRHLNKSNTSAEKTGTGLDDPIDLNLQTVGPRQIHESVQLWHLTRRVFANNIPSDTWRECSKTVMLVRRVQTHMEHCRMNESTLW